MMSLYMLNIVLITQILHIQQHFKTTYKSTNNARGYVIMLARAPQRILSDWKSKRKTGFVIKRHVVSMFHQYNQNKFDFEGKSWSYVWWGARASDTT